MSKDLGASDEDLIQKSDEESDPKASFFDNTIDESENDNTVVQSMPMEESKKAVESQDSDAGQSDKNVFAENGNKSFMEIEVKKDKMRWLYMSELGAIFGEEKHTREGFIKVFGNRVSESDETLIKNIFLIKVWRKIFVKSLEKKTKKFENT